MLDVISAGNGAAAAETTLAENVAGDMTGGVAKVCAVFAAGSWKQARKTIYCFLKRR